MLHYVIFAKIPHICLTCIYAVSLYVIKCVMHFLKPVTVLTAFGNVLFNFTARVLRTFGTDFYPLCLTALPYLTALAEFVVVGRNRMTAVTVYVLGIKNRTVLCVLHCKIFSDTVVITLSRYVNGTFAAHYTTAGNYIHIKPLFIRCVP